MSADESITNLSEAVAALGALPMPAGPAPKAELGGYPAALPWARLMDDEDLADFLDELAASAITHASNARALAEVEDTIARWRLIGEAQHGHNTAPGPDAVTRVFAPVASLREPEPEFHAYLHHPYQREHDMPETGAQSASLPVLQFFQPGRLYAAGECFRFRCDSVTTDPETGKPRAMGRHGKLRAGDGKWLWVENGRSYDDWRGGCWVDITDAAGGA